ncbi:hypothetical protein [Microbacterium flavum]|uniref:Yip1 domain-containing protein n=1 Tax=Microbacterium flavum TaxID=415216 RepID=A0ABS5XTE0_9MICO|nr:hypothetical protein [Microbacterium flavum]MBT8797226.1 hypothetical protein [Microbacterium flavum]
MSQDPQTPPSVPSGPVPPAPPALPSAPQVPPTGWVQTSPGAPPVPNGQPWVYGAPFGSAPAPLPPRPRTLGLVALVVAIVAVVFAVVLSGATGFAAAEGAMRHAIGVSPSGLEHLSEQELLALLSPVRSLVLWAEIGYWTGTVLGLTALGLGIAAIVTRRGRGQGIAAVIIAAVGPLVFAVVVGLVVVAGIAAGAA